MNVEAQKKLVTELEALLAERAERETFRKIDFYEPYDWQKEFLKLDKDHAQVLLMAANRVGKSYTGAYRLAIHATGLYPEWWEGHKWEGPINIWAAGVSAESTRDILQNELMGPPDNIMDQGTGAIPKFCIGETTRKPQVPNALQSVLVKHHTDGKFDGWSRITFKAFEQGESKFMGSSVHEVWLDEQPPDGLFGQCITRTANTAGRVVMTFTPEDGVTPVIHQFTKNRKPGQALIGATWDDAPHLTEEVKTQLLGVYGEHERDMRSKGIPIFGSGPVFTVPDEELAVDPFEIPDFWPAIAGIDFGWDHPTAWVCFRWDRDADIVYLTDCYRSKKETVAVHAAAIRSKLLAPCAWPHDGNKHDGFGVTTADQYRTHGVPLLPMHFTNPVAPGESGKGNINVEPGINAMHERMQQGRFKVFRTCHDWFDEYRMYHREDGKIFALDDDLMSASRYAIQSLRYADIPTAGGGFDRSFSGKLKYEPMRILA